jgi:hypothetical protein
MLSILKGKALSRIATAGLSDRTCPSLPLSQQIDLLTVLPYHLKFAGLAVFSLCIKSERVVGAPATEPAKGHGANLRKKGYGL